MEGISLSELNDYLQRVIALNFEEAIWVHFELSNVKFSRGHMYFEAVEKEDAGIEVNARIGGVIWAKSYLFIQKKLKGIEKDLFTDGVKILAKVKIDFHPKYGLKLMVEDVDPAYTFGELALERDKVWKRILKEGLDKENTLLAPPKVIQRIAILSNETAAGYADFMAHLQGNSLGYTFDLSLFETAVQGMKVQLDLPDQIEVINEEWNDFDLVVIIRGGGSKLDLQAFDQYPVIKAVAKCAVPCWIGIGHEVDESLCDLVATRSLKTPTAVATAILDHNMTFESNLMDLYDEIKRSVDGRIQREDYKMDQLQFRLHQQIASWLQREQAALNHQLWQLSEIPSDRIAKSRNELQRIDEVLDLINPETIMKKGYAVVEKNKGRVYSTTELKRSDELIVHLSDGSFKTVIKEI